MEVIVLKGAGKELRKLAESLRGLKGVHTGELTLAETAGTDHGHSHTHKHPHKH